MKRSEDEAIEEYFQKLMEDGNSNSFEHDKDSLRQLIDYMRGNYRVTIQEIAEGSKISINRMNGLIYGHTKRMKRSELEGGEQYFRKLIEEGNPNSFEHDKDNLRQLIDYMSDNYGVTIQEIAEGSGIMISRLRTLLSGHTKKMKRSELEAVEGYFEKLIEEGNRDESFEHDKDDLRKLIDDMRSNYGVTTKKIAEGSGVMIGRLNNLLSGNTKRMKRSELEAVEGYFQKLIEEGNPKLIEYDKDNLRQLIDYMRSNYGVTMQEIAEGSKTSISRMNGLLYGQVSNMKRSELEGGEQYFQKLIEEGDRDESFEYDKDDLRKLIDYMRSNYRVTIQ